MDSLQTAVLVLATVILAVAAGVILWRELGRGAEGGFLQGWRDLSGLGATLGGLVVILTWLWATR
jgi:hypothetical protein